MNVPQPFPRQQRQAGLSLIELMVGLVIALVISLVIFNVFIAAEGQRRTTAAGSDAQQAGALSSYTLSRYLRMGGAGLDRASNLWGCNVRLSNSDTNFSVPLGSSAQAPFSDLGLTEIRATPVLIVNGSSTSDAAAGSATPDALMAFGGIHRSINTFFQGSRVPTTEEAVVLNSIGLQTGDLLLAVEQTVGRPNAGGDCQIVQATSAIDVNAASPSYLQSMDNNGRTIEIGGILTPNTGLVPPNGPYSADTLYANLGTAPLFRMFAVGPSAAAPSELRMLNLLDGTVQSLGDGVVNIQAVYGIAALPDSNVVTAWVPPVGAYGAATLMNGSAASAAAIDLIRAVRIVMVTRSALPERDAVSADEYTVFADDDALAITIARDDDAQKYRYRVFDEIVPVRNTLLPVTPPPVP
jgi:type IV pilus assembly protein PilW